MRTTPLALILSAVAVLVAFLFTRRRHRWRGALGTEDVPATLDLSDFGGASESWRLVVFTDDDCRACESVVRSLRPLAASDVALTEVEASSRPEMHRIYDVRSVPLTLVVNPVGGVDAWFRGPLSAEDVRLARSILGKDG